MSISAHEPEEFVQRGPERPNDRRNDPHGEDLDERPTSVEVHDVVKDG